MRQSYTFNDFKEFAKLDDMEIDSFILKELMFDSDEYCNDSIKIPDPLNDFEYEPRKHVINNILSFSKAFNVIKLGNIKNTSVVIN